MKKQIARKWRLPLNRLKIINSVDYFDGNRKSSHRKSRTTSAKLRETKTKSNTLMTHSNDMITQNECCRFVFFFFSVRQAKCQAKLSYKFDAVPNDQWEVWYSRLLKIKTGYYRVTIFGRRKKSAARTRIFFDFIQLDAPTTKSQSGLFTLDETLQIIGPILYSVFFFIIHSRRWHRSKQTA